MGCRNGWALSAHKIDCPPSYAANRESVGTSSLDWPHSKDETIGLNPNGGPCSRFGTMPPLWRGLETEDEEHWWTRNSRYFLLHQLFSSPFRPLLSRTRVISRPWYLQPLVLP